MTAGFIAPRSSHGLGALRQIQHCLGRPKPVRLEWRQAADADVLSARAIENQAIYVWLSFQDNAELRAYVLPWSQRAAEQLQAAQQTAGEQGTGIRVKLPFDSFADSDEHRFYAMPQMPLPPKNAQSNAGAMYAEP